jgi:hypothetical protein
MPYEQKKRPNAWYTLIGLGLIMTILALFPRTSMATELQNKGAASKRYNQSHVGVTEEHLTPSKEVMKRISNKAAKILMTTMDLTPKLSTRIYAMEQLQGDLMKTLIIFPANGTRLMTSQKNRKCPLGNHSRMRK